MLAIWPVHGYSFGIKAVFRNSSPCALPRCTVHGRASKQRCLLVARRKRRLSSPCLHGCCQPCCLALLFTDNLGVIWLEIKASEARTGKRLDELGEDTGEQRSDLKALGTKVDGLVESVLVARQS